MQKQDSIAEKNSIESCKCHQQREIVVNREIEHQFQGREKAWRERELEEATNNLLDNLLDGRRDGLETRVFFLLERVIGRIVGELSNTICHGSVTPLSSSECWISSSLSCRKHYLFSELISLSLSQVVRSVSQSASPVSATDAACYGKHLGVSTPSCTHRSQGHASACRAQREGNRALC